MERFLKLLHLGQRNKRYGGAIGALACESGDFHNRFSAIENMVPQIYGNEVIDSEEIFLLFICIVNFCIMLESWFLEDQTNINATTKQIAESLHILIEKGLRLYADRNKLKLNHGQIFIPFIRESLTTIKYSLDVYLA